jgi:hypothetical protein
MYILNSAFIAQQCGAVAADAYDHLVAMARVVSCCSFSSMVKGACDGFVIKSCSSSLEYIYGPKELLSTAMALAHSIVTGLHQPWCQQPLPRGRAFA